MSTINGTSRTFHVSGYQVVRLLGTGAHSTIWEVRDLRTQESYAIKRVVKNDKTDDRFIQQAVNEYEVARRIDHPNVRKIYKLRKIRKLFSVRELHLLMEFCPGRNASTAWRRGSGPPKASSIATSGFFPSPVFPIIAMCFRNDLGLMHTGILLPISLPM